MPKASISLSPPDHALQLVKAAGYRVTKPKQRKLTSRGPTCVVTFADGALCRMTTHCRDDALDWERGIKQRGPRGMICRWRKLRQSSRLISNVTAIS